MQLIPLPLEQEIRRGDDLVALLTGAVAAVAEELRDGDVLVVAQKPVSKAEGRVVELADVVPSDEALAIVAEDGGDARVVEVILREAATVVRRRGAFIVARTRHGFVCGSAGVDRSNQAGEDRVTLLPEDPDATARRLCEGIGQQTGAAVGIVISDSFGRPFRQGTVGVAVGVAGFAPLVEFVGEEDDAGRPFHSTRVHVADQIAAAADLLMGPRGRVPAVLVRGAPIDPDAGSGDAAAGGAAATVIPPERDLFA